MKKISVITLCSAVALLTNTALAQNVSDETVKNAKSSRSSTQRVAASQIRRNHDIKDFRKEYTDFKNDLSN